MIVNIVRIGNSRGIRIPKAFLEECEFKEHATLTMKKGRLILSPVVDKNKIRLKKTK